MNLHFEGKVLAVIESLANRLFDGYTLSSFKIVGENNEIQVAVFHKEGTNKLVPSINTFAIPIFELLIFHIPNLLEREISNLQLSNGFLIKEFVDINIKEHVLSSIFVDISIAVDKIEIINSMLLSSNTAEQETINYNKKQIETIFEATMSKQLHWLVTHSLDYNEIIFKTKTNELELSLTHNNITNLDKLSIVQKDREPLSYLSSSYEEIDKLANLLKLLTNTK